MKQFFLPVQQIIQAGLYAPSAGGRQRIDNGFHLLHLLIVKTYMLHFYCLDLYASPHAHRESRMGFRLLPSSVNEYSTLGGTSA